MGAPQLVVEGNAREAKVMGLGALKTRGGARRREVKKG
jgi:hypothetical protein